MKEVSKFIPMEGNDEVAGENIETAVAGEEIVNSSFKVCGSSNNLPAKPSIWSKLKGIFAYEIKVELTPYQQKVEDEINEFLHQEVTWQGFKNLLFKEITIGKKK